MWGNLVDFFLNRVNLIADIIFQYKLVISKFLVLNIKLVINGDDQHIG